MTEESSTSAPQADVPRGTAQRPHFYDDLAKFVRREDLVPFVRLTNRGIFVEQTKLDLIFKAYQSWQQKVKENAETLSDEKIRKRLIGTESMPLMYLIEGKKCLVGFVMPNSIPQPGTGKQIPNTGTLFDPHSYLDARDPIFNEVEGVRLRTSAQEGVLILLQTKRAAFECGTDLVKKFAEFCRHSPQLTKEFPATRDALRNCLLPLLGLLAQARPLSPKAAILVPVEFARGDYQFLQYRSLIMIAKGSRLLQFYDSKGKGETEFLRSELSRLGGGNGEQGQVRGFSAAPEKSFHLGKIWFRGMSFLLHPNALRTYIRIHTDPRSRKRLPPRSTVVQVLSQLVPAFIRSQALDDAAVRKLPMRYREAGAKYRRFAEFIFVITDKNVISSCIPVRQEFNPRSGTQSRPQRARRPNPAK